MDLRKYLENYSSEADRLLRKYFSEKRKEALKIDPLAVDVLKTLENFIYGGKKVRGALTVLGYQMSGGKNLSAILPISCAVEIMHSSLLIHDDFIDKDEFRRGKPTVHKIYAKGFSDHYGASIALIIGDLGIFLSNQILISADFNNKLKAKALYEFERLLINTGYGEILDIVFDKKKDTSWEDLLNVRKYKTAHYTFVMPLTVGAILGSADKETLQSINNYGEPIGIGFQLRDDILGVFGDPKITGKSNESDIKEGKKTFIITKALQLADKKSRIFLNKHYGSPGLTTSEIEQIKGVFKKSGTIDYSQKLALDLANKGKKYVSKMTKDTKYQEILSNFADFVVTRDK